MRHRKENSCFGGSRRTDELRLVLAIAPILIALPAAISMLHEGWQPTTDRATRWSQDLESVLGVQQAVESYVTFGFIIQNISMQSLSQRGWVLGYARARHFIYIEQET